MAKTSWYKPAAALLLALCMVLGGLSGAAFADPAPALGYSVTDIGVDAGPYQFLPRSGFFIDLEVTFEGQAPTAAQLRQDGFDVAAVNTSITSESAQLQEMLEQDFFGASDPEDTDLYIFFKDSDGKTHVRLYMEYNYTTLYEADIRFQLSVRQNGGEVYLSDEIWLRFAHETIEVTAADAGRIDQAAYTIIRALEDVRMELGILHHRDQEEYDANLVAYVDMTAGGKYMGNAYWYEGTELSQEELGGLNLVGEINLRDNYGGVNGPLRYRIEVSERLLVYEFTKNGMKYMGTTDDLLDYPEDGYFELVAPGGSGNPGSSGGYTTGGGRGGSGGSSRGSSSGGNTADTARTAAVGGASGSNVGQDGAVNQAIILKETAQALENATGAAVVRTSNARSISAATLKAMADAAGDTPLVLHADTVSGGAVQGRLYVEPAKLTGITGSLQLEISTNSQSAQAVRSHFAAHFSNTVAVVHCGQAGGFGASLQIAARADLSGLDTGSLVFYSYDRQANSYTRINNPAYYIDSNGYLHFTTQLAGEIIIADAPLARK